MKGVYDNCDMIWYYTYDDTSYRKYIWVIWDLNMSNDTIILFSTVIIIIIIDLYC